MKELIYFTGQIDTPFFTNEIGYFCDSFDKVHVVVYGEPIKKAREIAEKFGFSYQFVNTSQQRLQAIPRLVEWYKRSYVVEETLRAKRNGKGFFKRLAYIFFYGIYAVTAEKIIKVHLNKCDELYLYSFWLSRPAFAIASMNYVRSEKIKCIAARTHRYDLYEEENSFGYLPFRKFIAENLDVIYFSSKDSYVYYREKAYSDNKKQAVRKLTYLGTNKAIYRKANKNSECIVMASCAYIIQRKRIDLIIKVMLYLSQLGMAIKWFHVGNGELEDKVKELAKQLLTNTNLEYHFMGKLSDEEIYELYHSENVDFFINMSDSEGIPVSLIEALSMGIPAIARDVGGNSDAVINGFNGILLGKGNVEDNDLRKLATEIFNIYQDGEKYKNYSEKAFEHWKNTFSGELNAKKVCDDMKFKSVIPCLK